MNKPLKEKYKEILKRLNITQSAIENNSRESIEGVENAAIELMTFAGIPLIYGNAAINGIPLPKCEHEFHEKWNWHCMYDTSILQYALEFSEKYMLGNETCEVGLKYPQFNVKQLVKKYDLRLTGSYEANWSKKEIDARKKIFYDVYQNPDKSISFSFEKNRIGLGGYAGATFPTLKHAYDFVKWFFNHKTYYVKDVDLFVNRLGGLNLDEIANINAEFMEYDKKVKQFIEA